MVVLGGDIKFTATYQLGFRAFPYSRAPLPHLQTSTIDANQPETDFEAQTEFHLVISSAVRLENNTLHGTQVNGIASYCKDKQERE